MCSGSEAGSHVRLIDFVYHSPLGLSVIKKKKLEGLTKIHVASGTVDHESHPLKGTSPFKIHYVSKVHEVSKVQ